MLYHTNLQPKLSCEYIIQKIYSIIETINTTSTAHTLNRLACNLLTLYLLLTYVPFHHQQYFKQETRA